jgi:tetratricopeptide (TPR) repeat protein
MKMIKKATLCLGLVVMGSSAFAQSLEDAKKAIDAEQYQKATTMLKSLVSSQASKPENYYYLGEVYLLKEYVDSARAIFTKGITADPKYSLNYVGLGHADLISDNAASAKTNFDKAIEVAKKKDHVPYLYIGKAYISNDKPDFAAALPNLQKADELDAKDQDVETFVALGDFYAAQKKNSEALQNYMRALNINEKLLRAKVQIGRMYKESRAFPESETELNDAITADPNYGPAYREIAELYMQWANQLPQEFDAKAALALTNYKKYLDLTDQSFDSRLRYAQFLFYARDFKTLQEETNSLATVSPNDPKSLIVSRLRGYSAYENAAYPQGVEYMTDFFSKVKDTTRIVGSDYVYLGKSLLKSGNDSLAYINILKGVQKDSTQADALEELGNALLKAKKYGKSADVYAMAVKYNPDGNNWLTNSYYVGVNRYFDSYYAKQAKKPIDEAKIKDADAALAKVNEKAPEFELAYFYRARLANLLDDENSSKGLSIPFYEQFVELVTVKKPDLAAKNKTQLIESYNNLGAWYAEKDRAKGIGYLNKSVELDPNGGYAPIKLKELNTPAKPAGKK